MYATTHYVWGCTLAAMLGMALTGAVQAQAPGAGLLRIESTPSAASVELIGGPAGHTPLVINERDIYPNDYPDARVDMYGMVVLSHPGCQPLRYRVKQSDMQKELRLSLHCSVMPIPPRAATTVSKVPLPTVPASPAQQEAMSIRRLRQLQVLEQLLDEGLISPAEEQRIRRQILEFDKGPSG